MMNTYCLMVEIGADLKMAVIEADSKENAVEKFLDSTHDASEFSVVHVEQKPKSPPTVFQMVYDYFGYSPGGRYVKFNDTYYVNVPQEADKNGVYPHEFLNNRLNCLKHMFPEYNPCKEFSYSSLDQSSSDRELLSAVLMARKAAHEAPLNMHVKNHKGEWSMGSHSMAWASAGREFSRLMSEVKKRGLPAPVPSWNGDSNRKPSKEPS